MGSFIDFMLEEILKTLVAHKGMAINSDDYVPNKCPNKVPNKCPNKVPHSVKASHVDMPERAWDILDLLMEDNKLSALALSERSGMSDRMVRRYIHMLKEAGLIVREGNNKNGYWKIENK